MPQLGGFLGYLSHGSKGEVARKTRFGDLGQAFSDPNNVLGAPVTRRITALFLVGL